MRNGNTVLIPGDLASGFNKAKEEIGQKEYDEKLRMVFDKPVLDYVDTIVLNMPETCYANCAYCIDNQLRKNVIDTKSFLVICEKTFVEFPNIKRISITGGSLKSTDFNRLMVIIGRHYDDIEITWNTNGILIDEKYDVSKIKYINLHRNSVNDDENRKIFQTNKKILTIKEAKELFGEKLNLRITVDENFNLDEYAKFNIPLYLNQLLPGTDKSNKIFEDVLMQLSISEKLDWRRRNQYLTCKYREVPVRICVGDKVASRVPGRYPVFLNVAIIHRSGKVCGSWYEDDKLLFSPIRKE